MASYGIITGCIISADSVNRFIPQTADCPAYGKFPCQPAFKWQLIMKENTPNKNAHHTWKW